MIFRAFPRWFCGRFPFYLINDCNHAGFRGHVLPLESESGFAPAANVDGFAGARSHRINGDDGRPLRPPANEPQRAGLQRRVLDRGNHAADDFAQIHTQSCETSSTMPTIAASTGVSLQPYAIRAELP